jgi:hypothetical protein
MAKFQTNSRLATSPAQTSLTTTIKTMLELASAATGRGQIYELEVGADGAPNATDCQIVYEVQRLTVTGTGVASTPTPLNPADAAARTTTKINHTIEPTITANSCILALALNQRASQRWIAAPGSELIWPNTSANGLTCGALSPTYAAPVLMTALFDDL